MNEHLKKFVEMVSEESSKINKIEKADQPQDTANYVANYLRQNIKEDREDKIDTSIPSKHSQNVSNSTTNDNIPTPPKDIEKQRWNDPLNPLDQKFVTFKDMNDHYSKFLGRIQQQMSTMSGGGEVNFLKLDDVKSNTKSDNRVLEYDAGSGKVQFTDNIGPIELIEFDITHDVSTHTHNVGTLCWDQEDQTLNIFHPNGVRQQVGQEQYAYVRNNTGSTIPNGTVVRFDGATTPDGEARIEVAPLLADGQQPGLYTIGVSTQDIDDGDDGKITVFGKVRDIDTTGSDVGETWVKGDILYVSPTTPGNFTKVKPTAPNNVTPIAAVLRVDSTEGEIFVRPTIEQKESYGRFARTTNFTFASSDTAYAIDFDTTEIANGAEIGSPPSRLVVDQSGFFQVDINLQADATGGGFSSAILYTWLRVNGVDVPDSTRRQGLLGSAPSSTFSYNIALSLGVNDYVEILVASNENNVVLDASPATSFAPKTASALVSVTQLQL